MVAGRNKIDMANGKAVKERGFSSTKRFFKDVKVELGKVNWPGKAEVIASTMVVLVTVAFFALFAGVVDQVFVFLIKLISA